MAIDVVSNAGPFMVDKERFVGRNIACLKISISELLAKIANRISIIISTKNLSRIIRDRIRDSRNNHAFQNKYN